MSTRHQIIPALLAFALLAGPAAAMAQNQTHTRTINKVETVTPSTRISVENLIGHVNVTQGGKQLAIKADVVAGGADMTTARALADTVKIDVSRDGNQLAVHVDYPVDKHTRYRIPARFESGHDGIDFLGIHIGTSYSHSTLQYQGRTVNIYRGSSKGVPLYVDLAIQLPEGVNATIKNHVGLTTAHELSNDLTLRSDDGDVQVYAINGKLAIHTGDGDASVDKLRGNLDLHTADGDVKISDIQGDTIGIHTGDGDVRMNQVRGDVRVDTGDGDIHGDALTDKLHLSTGDGDVILKNLHDVSSARVACGDGDIHLSGNLSGLANFSLQSGNGDIRMATQQPPAVHLSINAEDIRVDWPDMRNVEHDRHSYRGDVGNARGNGSINAGNGDVVLKR